jgi:hypothetical protein
VRFPWIFGGDPLEELSLLVIPLRRYHDIHGFFELC